VFCSCSRGSGQIIRFSHADRRAYKLMKQCMHLLNQPQSVRAPPELCNLKKLAS
jgi:hypothetical protein